VPQLRATQKFSRDLKIKILDEPIDRLPFFDDWFIDVIRIARKKVAFAMHSNTLFSFLIPYTHVGGAKGVPLAIRDLLIKFVIENKFPQYQEKIYSVFNEKIIYCKTKDRSVLGHMNDFKNFIEGYTGNLSFSEIDWNAVMAKLNTTLAGDSKGNYNRPVDLMLGSLINGC
jgi:hypothetical protein